MSENDRVWRGWEPGEFQAHFIHTGVAESVFFVFPDSTTMLLDCGDQASITRGKFAVPALPGPERLAGEWVARYVRRANPNGAEVDWAVVSHFHSDHVGTPSWQKFPWFPDEPDRLEGCPRCGFALAAETLRFRRATDRGWPDYDDPMPSACAEEVGVVHRGRNANIHMIPKGASRGEYRKATALEALFGWLYLQHRTERINELFDTIMSTREEEA